MQITIKVSVIFGIIIQDGKVKYEIIFLGNAIMEYVACYKLKPICSYKSLITLSVNSKRHFYEKDDSPTTDSTYMFCTVRSEHCKFCTLKNKY